MMEILSETAIQPVIYTRIFISTAERFGVNRKRLLEAAELDEWEIHNPLSHIKYEQYKNLYREAKATATNPALFLYFGESLDLTNHGQLGAAVFSSASFTEALDKIKRFIKLQSLTYEFDIEFKDNHGCISIDSCIPDKSLYVQEIEQFISGMHKSLKIMPNSANKALKFNFSYPKPAHGHIYQEFFGEEVYFNCPRNEIIFEADSLIKHWVKGDSTLEKNAVKKCVFALQNIMTKSNSMKEKVREAVYAYSFQIPKQHEIAERLNVTPRTMVRHLTKENTSYQKIIDSIRKDRALHYLKTSELTLQEIAELTGFSCSTNFSRAFKKWTGVAPSTVRSITTT